MPRRFITYSRTEPVRVIIFSVGLILLLSQMFTLTPWYIHPDIEALSGVPAHPSFGEKAPLAFLFALLGTYAIWSTIKNNLLHIGRSCWWMHIVFTMAALTRAVYAPDPGNLLWLGYGGLAVVLGICYLYSRNQYHSTRRGDLG